MALEILGSKEHDLKKEGSKENVIWEQGAQKIAKRIRERPEIGKWSKEQEKLSGNKER